MTRAGDREVTALLSRCDPETTARDARAGAYRRHIENRIRAGNTSLSSMAA
jgi:hypothetical protein